MDRLTDFWTWSNSACVFVPILLMVLGGIGFGISEAIKKLFGKGES